MPADDPALKSGKPYDKLKMPTFYLSDRETNAIVTWVISNRDKLITPKLLAASNWNRTGRSRGRQLAQKYNCVACHIIEGISLRFSSTTSPTTSPCLPRPLC